MDFNFDFNSVTQVFNKVKNAVMNYTEYEIKVRDATNNEPWGASSTLMNEIASATWHFQHFTEIMTTIYKRLEESSTAEWRKVYKSLQLLEFLLKNGSENVLDSVKTHSRDISILESFHFIDDKGKDQGINVRVRAKEILDLANSPSKLEEERAKAKANKSKYTGVSSTGFSSSSFSSGSVSSSGRTSHLTTSFESSQSQRKSDTSFKDFEKFKVQETKKNDTPSPVQEVDLLNFDDAPSNAVVSPVETGFNNDEWGEFTGVSCTVGDSNIDNYVKNSPVSPLPVIGSVNPVANTNNDFKDFADFQSLKISNHQPIEAQKGKDGTKDPYANLVNLDSLELFTVKDAGPSLADLAKNKN